MNRKLYACSIFLCTSLSLNACQLVDSEILSDTINEFLSTLTRSQLLSAINQKDHQGNTPLHIVTFSPEERDAEYPLCAHFLSAQNRKDENYDKRQAIEAARLIMLNADISIENTRGLTVWHIMQKNQYRFPTLYEVITAAHCVQDMQKSIQAEATSKNALIKYSSAVKRLARHAKITLKPVKKKTKPTLTDACATKSQQSPFGVQQSAQ